MPSAWTVAALGAALGVSLAAPPGPVLALSAERAVRRTYLAGLVVALGATAADATWAVLMGVGLVPFLAAHPVALALLGLGGGLLMLHLAVLAWRTGRRPPHLEDADPAVETGRARWDGLAGGFAAGYVLAVTSPFNLAWWLGAGTALFERYGTLVFVAFFAAIVLYSAAFLAVVRWAGRRVAWVVKAVSYGSAVLLAAFAALVLVDAARTLL